MSASYRVPTHLQDSTDIGDSRSFTLKWFGLPFWKERGCHRCTGDIALQLEQNNGTRTIYIDGQPTPSIIRTLIPPVTTPSNADRYATEFFFEDPNHLGGWVFSCPHEEVICIYLVESSLHLIEDEATFDALTELLYNLVFT